jgi:hypothetical protein
MLRLNQGEGIMKRVVMGAGLLLLLARSAAADGRHLVRIGPQALVSEDDRGHVTMVDEATAEPRRSAILPRLFTVLGVEAVLLLEVQGEGFFQQAPPALATPRSELPDL